MTHSIRGHNMGWVFVCYFFSFLFQFFCLLCLCLGLLFLLSTITSIGWPPGDDGVELTAVVPEEGLKIHNLIILMLFLVFLLFLLIIIIISIMHVIYTFHIHFLYFSYIFIIIYNLHFYESNFSEFCMWKTFRVWGPWGEVECIMFLSVEQNIHFGDWWRADVSSYMYCVSSLFETERGEKYREAEGRSLLVHSLSLMSYINW